MQGMPADILYHKDRLKYVLVVGATCCNLYRSASTLPDINTDIIFVLYINNINTLEQYLIYYTTMKHIEI